MNDRLEKLQIDAAECDLIANLAVENAKRDAFRKMAEQYRAMADELKAVIASSPPAVG